MKKPIHILKIGGKIIDDEQGLSVLLQKIAQATVPTIVIHGGGNIASRLMEKMGIESTFHEGKRITNQEALQVAVMVYAGLLNKQMVARINASSPKKAIGLSGADMGLLTSTKRPAKPIDFGFVGDLVPQGVNVDALSLLIDNHFLPICCAITADTEGNLLNTNADTIASSIAVALSTTYRVSLVYSFEQKGVLADKTDSNSVIHRIDPTLYQDLLAKGIVSDGMIPKLNNAFSAIREGVHQVIICHHSDIHQAESAGTVISL